MVARKAPAVQAAGAPAPKAEEAKVPDFEVVGDDLVCHTYGDLRLPLVIPMSTVDRWVEINASSQSWREQITAWQAEVIPADVLEAIRDAARGDGICEVELCRQWSAGLDVRLGKALS